MKTSINKPKYKENLITRLVDNNFNQLKQTQTNETTDDNISEKINSFFEMYDELFFNIPKTGNQSHETLIIRSSDYVDVVEDSDLINSLVSEINDLKQQNNTLNQILKEISDKL